MPLFAWIILGLIAGVVGSKIADGRSRGMPLDILFGVVGAIAGGWMFCVLGAPGVTGLNLCSLFVAAIGSVFSLVLYHGGAMKARKLHLEIEGVSTTATAERRRSVSTDCN